MKRKICIITGIFPPDIGGPATYLESLCEELGKDKKNQVSVITLSEIDKPYGVTTVSNMYLLIRIKRNMRKLSRFILTIYLIIKYSRSVDILFVNSLYLEAFIAISLLRKRNKKIIYKVVGDVLWERLQLRGVIKDSIEDFQKKKYNLLIETLRLIRNSLFIYADIIIVPSFYLKNIVKNWFIKEEKIKVIHNFINIKEIEEIKEIEKAKRGEGEREIIEEVKKLNAEKKAGRDAIKKIVVAGRLVPWKHVDEVIRVMESIPDVELLIIGSGPMEGYLRELVVELFLEERVRFLGRVSREVLLRYLYESDILVLNSEYEGMPHLLLEAMAVGIPIVATRIGGITELIEDGVSGLLFERGNLLALRECILRLKEESWLGRRLSENAKKILTRRFSSQQLLKETLALFNAEFGIKDNA